MNSRKENEANNTPVLVEADSCLIDTNGDNNEATETTEVVDIEAEVIKNKSTNKITCELIGHLNITKSGCSNIKSNHTSMNHNGYSENLSVPNVRVVDSILVVKVHPRVTTSP